MIGLNNPFNIRYNPLNRWIGLCGETRGFCDFKTIEYCVRAVGVLILRSYKKKGIYTISEIINRYAPKSENDTFSYVEFICRKMGMLPFDKPANLSEYAYLVYFMSIYEGNRVSLDTIFETFKKYFKNEDFC